jgi:hypothetical protein
MYLKYFKSKFVCVFIVFVLLLQSCAVYQKSPVSIAEATATNHKVLILKTDDTELKLKKIELINGMYYGLTKDDNLKLVKVRLNESEIKTIRVLDKSTSTLLTIGAVAVPIIAVIIIVSTADIYGCDGCGLAE